MSTTTYLSTLSHPLIWKKYAEVACLTKLGLWGDFEVRFPLKTQQYIDVVAFDLARTAKEAGEKIGSAHYKKFRTDKTRLTPEEVDDVWLAVRLEMQGKLNEEYGTEQKSFLVPGAEEITIDRLVPISEDAKRIMNDVSKEKIESELNEAKLRLTKDNFWQNLRTTAWAHWEKEFDLFKADDPARDISKK
ncbi:MAG: hypothetical protein HYV90_02035 [Candidatus Woesebacteria bacterium]|nr:MAG: hypothetical protein HYV90_02035 [Candidatus Woesebacteria bacterium]